MNTMKSRLIRHYVPLLLLILITSFVFQVKNPKMDLITLTADSSAYLAIILIAASLMIGPIHILFKRSYPVFTYFRRDIGIAAGVVTLIHFLSSTGSGSCWVAHIWNLQKN